MGSLETDGSGAEMEGTVMEKPCRGGPARSGRLHCLSLARRSYLVWICLGANRNHPSALFPDGISGVLWSHICACGTCVWVWERMCVMGHGTGCGFRPGGPG